MTKAERDELIAAVRTRTLTFMQRSELAAMAGTTICLNSISECHRWPNGSKSGKQWLPETSRDDCRPLLCEIDRRKLWWDFNIYLDRRGPINRSPPSRHYLYRVTPADIVVAFIKTMEGVKDGK